MRTVLFDWKNSCHISKPDIVSVFQQVSEKIQIFFLSLHIIFIFSENTVPFINNKNKWNFVLSINFLQHVNQICLIQIIKIRILSQKITKNIFAEKLTHPVNIMCATEKILHVQKNCIISV